MTKKLNVPTIANELKGESSFFKPPTTPSRRHDVKVKKKVEKKSESVLKPHNKYELWGEIIADASTQHTTVRLTAQESDNVSGFTRKLRRKHKIRISMNELARLGLLFLMDDFNDNGNDSIVAKAKKGK